MVIGRSCVFVPMKSEKKVHVIARVQDVPNGFFGKSTHLATQIAVVGGASEKNEYLKIKIKETYPAVSTWLKRRATLCYRIMNCIVRITFAK